MKTMQKMNQWTFDKKMRILFSFTLITLFLVFVTVSTTSFVSNLREQTIELMRIRNQTVADNIRVTFEECKTIAIGLSIEPSIQEYMRKTDSNSDMKYELLNEANETIWSTISIIDNINFIGIADSKRESYLYKGANTLAITDFENVYLNDYTNSNSAQGTSLKVSFNNNYYKGERYTLNIYFPVYNVLKIGEELGLIVINSSEINLEKMISFEHNDLEAKTELIDSKGNYVATRQMTKSDDYFSDMTELDQHQGIIIKDKFLFVYRKIEGWDYYVISSIPMSEIYASSTPIVIFMFVTMLITLIIGVTIVSHLVSKFYLPINSMIDKMDEVSEGSLYARIDEEHMGEDLRKLATGFNGMMNEIIDLMKKNQEEHTQLERIRYNTLQSQIKPHFLYNTLECIHWQAISSGERTVSELVKALARYYRICLSDGKDMITIGEEMEHVRNYLIIQNIRYDEIIQCNIQLESRLANYHIPKMTLQPLVENSIYHGIKGSDGKKGNLNIRVIKENDDILITLDDDGIGMTNEQIDELNTFLQGFDSKLGYGVQNVHRRIKLLFGKEYGLKYASNKSGGITVTIRISEHHVDKAGELIV